MDKEVERIMKEIEKSLASVKYAKREQWALSPNCQVCLPQKAYATIDSDSG